MNKWILIIALICSAGCLSDRPVHAEEPANLASTAPSGLKQDQVLDMLHQSGLELKAFTANVSLTETDTNTGDAPTRTGKVWYQLKPNGDARMRVTFDKRELEGKVREEKLEYLLDDAWLVDRNYRGKTEIRRQVLKPGQKINLLKLGEGPFPLPIGQDKESVYKEFDVTMQKPAEGDPANTVHLTLAPNDSSKFKRKFKTIDVWVNLDSKMPVRIDTMDRNGAMQRSTTLDFDKSGKPKDNDFTLSPVKDWNVEIQPFTEQP
jgi:outer membrane lipoprotein-sorting protein